ncbi:outer membrane protein assembly factor BamB family protein [Actinoplanes flavus]|uniref:PQQ-binding-like beta-propeller repeat protein n=1 Tax=Actinoplanes flavus TaxID=2820290 RepID=A0ABS3UED9_9ACTN|nr:PQQ-binding-like beta-propeller repeat protein [Actinoplanes flavus]MBO3736052.1 PQQ-binding-like beta-propeller repeat protein [Actinoplanes flavus]
MSADPASSGPVVIDLGLERGEPETYHRPERRTTPLWLGPALLAVLLLFSVAAAAPPPGPPLSELLRLAISPGDPDTLTSDGRLVVQRAGELSSYDLETGDRQWRVAQDIPVYRLRTGGGQVLLRPWAPGRGEPGTTAVSLRTGALTWHHERNVITFPGDDLMLAVEGVRSLSGNGRRVEKWIEMLDPAAGAARWRLWVPSTAVLLAVPGPPGGPGRLLLVRDDLTAQLYEVATGTPLAAQRMPAANYDPDNPVVAGGLVLLRHPGPSGIEISAYDPLTLRPLWTQPATGTREIQACGPLACLIGLDGVRAIDPATGDQRWHRPGWRSVEESGAGLIAYADGPEYPAGVVDARTGRLLVDLTGWRPVGGAATGGELLVTREIGPGPRTMVAVAAPGLPHPRLLAELPTGTGECQTAPERLICRSVYGELVVWAYRPLTA